MNTLPKTNLKSIQDENGQISYSKRTHSVETEPKASCMPRRCCINPSPERNIKLIVAFPGNTKKLKIIYLQADAEIGHHLRTQAPVNRWFGGRFSG